MHANHKTIIEARHKLGITLNWLLEPVSFYAKKVVSGAMVCVNTAGSACPTIFPAVGSVR
jgi:hypothetical protein